MCCYLDDMCYDKIEIGNIARSEDGVVVGENVAIGACSLVNKSVVDNSIVVGIPAKEINKKE